MHTALQAEYCCPAEPRMSPTAPLICRAFVTFPIDPAMAFGFGTPAYVWIAAETALATASVIAVPSPHGGASLRA
nr:hypothetical protein [Bacillus safensis]